MVIRLIRNGLLVTYATKILGKHHKLITVIPRSKCLKNNAEFDQNDHWEDELRFILSLEIK